MQCVPQELRNDQTDAVAESGAAAAAAAAAAVAVAAAAAAARSSASRNTDDSYSTEAPLKLLLHLPNGGHSPESIAIP